MRLLNALRFCALRSPRRFLCYVLLFNVLLVGRRRTGYDGAIGDWGVDAAPSVHRARTTYGLLAVEDIKEEVHITAEEVREIKDGNGVHTVGEIRGYF